MEMQVEIAYNYVKWSLFSFAVITASLSFIFESVSIYKKNYILKTRNKEM